MKKGFTISLVLCASAALGLTMGCSAGDPSTAPSGNPQDPTAGAQAPTTEQEQPKVDETALALDRAFSDQFVKGKIDREALSDLVEAVVQSVPEDQRAKANERIDSIFSGAQKLMEQMTPEQREQFVTAPPPEEKPSNQQQDALRFGGWGWGGHGWGGWGWGGHGWGWGWGRGWGGWGWGRGWGGWGWGRWGFPGWGWGWGGGCRFGNCGGIWW